MYLKKMLFAVVGVAMLFSGIFPAAAQEQKTETQVNTNLASEQLNVKSEEKDSMEEEAMEFNCSGVERELQQSVQKYFC